MPASYRIDKERRLVLSTAWARFTFADAVAHKDKLLSDPDFDPSYSEIADFTEITEMVLSADEIRTFAEYDVFSPRSRRAFITLDDEEFGLARMFATLRELRGETGIAAFRTVGEALDWVLAKSE